MRDGRSDATQLCGARAENISARAWRSFRQAALGTHVSRAESRRAFGIFTTATAKKPQERGKSSYGAASYGRRDSLIREEIIGHRMRSVVPWLASGKRVRHTRGALALLQKPAGKHGRGVLLDPLVEQSTDLFAEIGSVVQAGKLITLQRVARSGQKEFPRRLHLGTRHGFLLKGNLEL